MVTDSDRQKCCTTTQSVEVILSVSLCIVFTLIVSFLFTATNFGGRERNSFFGSSFLFRRKSIEAENEILPCVASTFFDCSMIPQPLVPPHISRFYASFCILYIKFWMFSTAFRFNVWFSTSLFPVTPSPPFSQSSHFCSCKTIAPDLTYNKPQFVLCEPWVSCFIFNRQCHRKSHFCHSSAKRRSVSSLSCTTSVILK